MQLVTLQPVALAQAGTNVRAAAGEQQNRDAFLFHRLWKLPTEWRGGRRERGGAQRGRGLAEGLRLFHQDKVRLWWCRHLLDLIFMIYRSSLSLDFEVLNALSNMSWSLARIDHNRSEWLVSSASIRLLLRILQQQQSSFVLRRTEDTLMRTDEALQRLNPTETTLQALTEVRTRCCLCVGRLGLECEHAFSLSLCHLKVMSEDLIPEKMREDNQDGESLTSVCMQNFRERWWNKILRRRVLEAGRDQRTCWWSCQTAWKMDWKSAPVPKTKVERHKYRSSVNFFKAENLKNRTRLNLWVQKN